MELRKVESNDLVLSLKQEGKEDLFFILDQLGPGIYDLLIFKKSLNEKKTLKEGYCNFMGDPIYYNTANESFYINCGCMENINLNKGASKNHLLEQMKNLVLYQLNKKYWISKLKLND